MSQGANESVESRVHNDKGKEKASQEQEDLTHLIQEIEGGEQEDNDETTSPPRDEQRHEESQIQEGRSSIIEWLKERIAQEVIVVEEKQTYDIASLLNQT